LETIWKSVFASIGLELYSISVLHRPRPIMAKEGIVVLRTLTISSVRKLFIYNASLK